MAPSFAYNYNATEVKIYWMTGNSRKVIAILGIIHRELPLKNIVLQVSFQI